MREWSLARQLLVLQVVIVGVIVGGGSILAYLDAAKNTEDAARREVVAVAKSVADTPTLLNSLATARPTDTLQPFADNSGLTMILVEQNLDFIAALSKRILIIQKGTITREVQQGDLGDASLIGEFIGITT